MNNLRISLVQDEILWERRSANLKHFEKIAKTLKGKSDLVVLPEAFSTGFSMNVTPVSEGEKEDTMEQISQWAKEADLAICGSYIVKDKELMFNRGFFVTPGGERFFYDKRHLFRMGDEHKKVAPGNEQTTVTYRGWRIRLAICYDLRFPVWLRNVENDYDLLVVSANWPEARNEVWEVLLRARAIENQCYVCGVNRTGKDGNGVPHMGNSLLIDYKGIIVERMEKYQEYVITKKIDKEALSTFRNKFPVWMDADRFEIK